MCGSPAGMLSTIRLCPVQGVSRDVVQNQPEGPVSRTRCFRKKLEFQLRSSPSQGLVQGGARIHSWIYYKYNLCGHGERVSSPSGSAGLPRPLPGLRLPLCRGQLPWARPADAQLAPGWTVDARGSRARIWQRALPIFGPGTPQAACGAPGAWRCLSILGLCDLISQSLAPHWVGRS